MCSKQRWATRTSLASIVLKLHVLPSFLSDSSLPVLTRTLSYWLYSCFLGVFFWLDRRSCVLLISWAMVLGRLLSSDFLPWPLDRGQFACKWISMNPWNSYVFPLCASKAPSMKPPVEGKARQTTPRVRTGRWHPGHRADPGSNSLHEAITWNNQHRIWR